MNIYLVPYTALRHVTVALPIAGAALLVWWALLLWEVWLGPETGLLWVPALEGPLFLCSVACTVSGMSVLSEGSLRRRGMLLRLALPLLAALVTLLITGVGYVVVRFALPFLPMVEGDLMAQLVVDPSYASLTYRLPYWLAAGFGAGVGPWVVRRGRGFVAHVGGGLAAAALGAAVWHWFGYHLFDDLYLGSGIGVFVWASCFGALSWSIPRDLYAGWVRVLSAHRYGRRIPVDGAGGEPRERFVGHYPRGLDLYLPAAHGVAELHASFVCDAERHYTVRGLSQAPTRSHRFLERVDVRYDPRRPAPLETALEHEDTIVLSDGHNETVLEFLLLPKEER